jgi:Protein of unknown function (DUF3015)
MLIKKLILISSVLAGSLAANSLTFAADGKETGSGPNPYTDCGIGAALFTETKWAAVTSNVIWDLGITALISATSSPQTCQGKKVVAAMFINHTLANLSEEAASGQGEHLTTVLNIMECDSSHHSLAVAKIRGDMGGAVSDPTYLDRTHLDKAFNFYSIVEKAVDTSCSS